MEKIKKILIIDDEKVLVENIFDFLSLNGFHVIVAYDGNEGIQKAISHSPDLIVCDIMMPNLDGLDVYRTLKNIPGTIDIPFLFLTAKVQLDDIRKGLQLGVDDYITKPFMLSDLLSSINMRIAKYERLKNCNEEKFNALFYSPLIGVFIYFKNKIIFSNQKFADILNVSLKDVYNIDLKNIFTGKNMNQLNANIDLCSENNISDFLIDCELIDASNKEKKVKIYGKNFKFKMSYGIIFNIVENQKDENIDEIVKNKLETFNFENTELTEEFSQFLEDKYKTPKLNNAELLLQKLTKREKEVLKLICEGYTNQEIADKLFLSKRTVEGHRNSIIFKTNSKNTAELVSFTIQNNLKKLL